MLAIDVGLLKRTAHGLRNLLGIGIATPGKNTGAATGYRHSDCSCIQRSAPNLRKRRDVPRPLWFDHDIAQAAGDLRSISTTAASHKAGQVTTLANEICKRHIVCKQVARTTGIDPVIRVNQYAAQVSGDRKMGHVETLIHQFAEHQPANQAGRGIVRMRLATGD